MVTKEMINREKDNIENKQKELEEREIRLEELRRESQRHIAKITTATQHLYRQEDAIKQVYIAYDFWQ